MSARLLALFVALLIIPSVAAAFSDTAYCLANARAERQLCSAAELEALALCASDYAFDRWIGTDTAQATVLECRGDAKLEALACVAEVDGCTAE